MPGGFELNPLLHPGALCLVIAIHSSLASRRKSTELSGLPLYAALQMPLYSIPIPILGFLLFNAVKRSLVRFNWLSHLESCANYSPMGGTFSCGGGLLVVVVPVFRYK